MKSFLKKLAESLKISAIALVLTLGVTYAYAAWTGPTSPPPNGNTPAPVNVGTVDQIKNAGLGVNTLAVYGDSSLNGYVKIGATTIACSAPIEGALRFDTSNGDKCLQLCVDLNWKDVSCNSTPPPPPPTSCAPGTQTYSVAGSFPFSAPSGCSTLTVKAWGGGGGAGPYYNNGGSLPGKSTGGSGGFASGVLQIKTNDIFIVKVGAGGVGQGLIYAQLIGGGGLSGVFKGNSPLIIAGGGGAGSGGSNGAIPGSGGAGGGKNAGNGTDGSRGRKGQGGSQLSGGFAGLYGLAGGIGTYLLGGIWAQPPTGDWRDCGVGGGGDGYYGGGSGGCYQYNGTGGAGGGGGGSGYIASGITNLSNLTGSGRIPPATSDINYPGGNVGYGAPSGAPSANSGKNGYPGFVILTWK